MPESMLEADHRTAYERILDEIRELDLGDYIGELETRGYTVVPPERIMTKAEHGQLLDAVLDWAARCTGERPDLAADDASTTQKSDFDHTMPTILNGGPIFEKMIQHPVVLAFATWLTGYSTTVDFYAATIKGRGGAELELHADAQLIAQVPGPLPPYSLGATCTLALTEYSREKGCTFIVPGSHKRCSWASGPVSTEPTAVPIECPAGSLIVWHGNTWHGALPRTAPGKRASLLMYYTRHWLRSREEWGDAVSDEVLARNPPRLATLLGRNLPFGYHDYHGFVDKVIRNARPRTALGRAGQISQWT